MIRMIDKMDRKYLWDDPKSGEKARTQDLSVAGTSRTIDMVTEMAKDGKSLASERLKSVCKKISDPSQWELAREESLSKSLRAYINPHS
ncbi:hypothetical protein M0802_012088 [Mischocyttarus mexicanus]|nr:hypothetical protein M0802_012088 [Mischocyttarus mexicanus]